MRILLATLVALAAVVAATPGEAQRYRHRPHHPPGYWQDRHDDYRNRRDARRAGIAAAIVVSGVSKAAQERRIEERYRECLRESYYDIDCDRRRYYEEQQARIRARRSGLVTGVIVREAVRD